MEENWFGHCNQLKLRAYLKGSAWDQRHLFSHFGTEKLKMRCSTKTTHWSVQLEGFSLDFPIRRRLSYLSLRFSSCTSLSDSFESYFYMNKRECNPCLGSLSRVSAPHPVLERPLTFSGQLQRSWYKRGGGEPPNWDWSSQSDLPKCDLISCSCLCCICL